MVTGTYCTPGRQLGRNTLFKIKIKNIKRHFSAESPSFFLLLTFNPNRLRWSRGSVLAFGTQVRGFNPGRSRRIFKGEKILSTPSFGGEVKLSVPCRRFAACKRSLELRGSQILDEICRNISRPRRVPPSAARGLSRRWTWRHLAEKEGTSKGGGKQWQPTPKNLSGRSVPEPYRSPEWVLVSAKTGLRAEY